MGVVSPEMLQALMLRALEGQSAIEREMAALRREIDPDRSVLVGVIDQGRRTERRLAELRDDIELMVRAELMGRPGHFETQIERRLEAPEQRLAPH